MRYLWVAIFVLLSGQAIAQPTPTTNLSIDEVALQIPYSMTESTGAIARYISTHFTADEDKIRAAFAWVAITFTYDVHAMRTLKGKDTEMPEDKIARSLHTHKGICANYALVFADICTHMGFRAYMITGYTRHNGEMSDLPHGWNCVFVNGQWHLYDPTWASGYINGNSFTKKLNNTYYDQPPSQFIKEHMPYDPMWQLLEFPVTRKEFATGATDSTLRKAAFYFTDSIAAYEQMSEQEQLLSTAARIQHYDVPNDLTTQKLDEIADRLRYMKQLAEYNINNDNVAIYNDAVADYNQGVALFNKFIEYRNRRFRPAKSDQEIESMITNADKYLSGAAQKITNLKASGTITESQLSTFRKNLSLLLARVNDQKTFVSSYLAKDKEERKNMLNN